MGACALVHACVSMILRGMRCASIEEKGDKKKFKNKKIKG